MWPHSSSQKRYFGVNTSLYSALDSEAIELLEKAIYFTRLCFYDEAQRIFEDKLAAFKHIPVVIIEWAELYLQQFRLHDVIGILENGLEAAQNRHIDTDFDSSEYRLMRLLLGFCEISGKGRLERALQEIDRTADWLANLPVGEYSDIQVNCIRKYINATYYTKLHCNKCRPDYTDIPRPSGAVVRTWQGLTDLRNALLQQGRLGEAVALHRGECAALPLAPRIDAHHIVLSCIQTAAAAAPDDIHILWLEVEVQVLLADSLYQADDIQQAKVEVQKAEALANQCLLQLGINDPRPLLSLRWTGLLIGWQGISPHDRHSKSMALLADMKITRHIRTASCFDKAAESALEIYRETKSSHYYDEFFRLRKDVGDYLEMVQGDISTLLLWREPLWNETRELAIDKSTTLKWYGDFLRRYPVFALPKPLYNLHKMRKLIFEFLGDTEQAMAAKLEMDKIEADIPESVSEKMCWSQAIVRPDSEGVHDSVTKHYPLVDEDNFYAVYASGIVNGSEDFKKITMRMFLKWSAEDLQDSILSERELHTIIQLQPTTKQPKEAMDFPGEEQKSGDILGELRRLSESDLLCRIFGNNEEPLEKSLWSSRFQTLEAWLGRPSCRSSYNGRQNLLINLQEIRAYSVMRHDLHRETAIEEFLRCINILPNLPEAVQTYIGSRVGYWHSMVCLLFAKCIIGTNPADRRLRQDFLDKAFEHCLKAIEAWKKDEVNAESRESQRRDLAALCLLALEENLAESEKERVSLRQMGLRNLRLIDEWLRNVRQDLPSADNRVKEVRQREHITQQLKPSEVYLCALRIFLTAAEFSPEERLDFWNWVQQSKARALAETMGAGESIPSSLLSALKTSSKDSYKLFLEEQELRGKVANATPNDRYYLLAMLKRKRQEMRRIPELRQILDLIEGTPLRMEDLPMFSAGNDTSVVFVDWVEIPYFFKPGNQQVVVTVKAGETPKVHVLETTGEDLVNWFLPIFQHEKETLEIMMRDPDIRERLLELGELVEPLSSCTRPGDLLVFCLTNILHRIPLHAIEVEEPSAASGSQTLIHRNPVIYCPSLSVMRHCFCSSKALSTSSLQNFDMAIFHGIPPDDNVQDDIFAAGRMAIRDLATRFTTRPVLDQNLTRETFTEKTSTSSLIHIHSHIKYEKYENDPLKRYYLRFGTAVQPWTLTPKDVLESLHFPAGSHITLVACDGAQFHIGPGDELLGIVPALLCAGASSVISTLWKTADKVGATFTNGFYEAFEADGGMVDVARAFQRVVISMDEGEREPLYRWAGFVLHGYWNFGRDGMEIGK
ncbi:hypothetical protein K440DRAFT_661607 [Wilcoxina mikolae CBS 423.85]|nr:hypothetical protein K440DRAFT_661607 [Wilcoxina mikolae CBS 423.85]